VLLVDDFPAELGEPFQRAMIAALLAYPGQCFVTSIERTAALAAIAENPRDSAMFHVEHGSVSRASRV
jgi:recombinational DNA repair ATPase RecF